MGGLSGQQKIKNLKIGIAGLGGMGSNIAEIFARVGVGHLRLTDPDIIERANINRQVIAFETTLGRLKAEVLAGDLEKISSDIKIEFSIEGIQTNNVEKFVEGMDVIINEIDVYHIDKHILLIEAAHKLGITVYTTLVVGLGIHLYKFDPCSSCNPRDFFAPLLADPSIENLIDRLGGPLPSYLRGSGLKDFVSHVKEFEGVPIFGASTYMGQSLLAIRVLYDQKMIVVADSKCLDTPALPKFLILDPLLLQLKTAELKPNGEFIIHED